jgi:hypothetical protein
MNEQVQPRIMELTGTANMVCSASNATPTLNMKQIIQLIVNKLFRR